MAAFIQKLFKNRKAVDSGRKTRKPPEPVETEQEDTRASQREQQLQALSGSPSQPELAEIATQGATADIRLSAAGRLSDPALLQDVQKRAKGKDKGVYQAVKQALQTHRDEQARRESIRQTITTLISQASDQARSDDTKLYRARLEALTKQWADVEAHASPEQVQAFLEAAHRCRERLAAIHSAAQEEQRQQDQRTQRQETLSLLADTLNELANQAPEALPSLASLDALQKTQENRWLEATRDTSVDKQEQKAYETAMLTLRGYLGAVRRISQERETLAELAGVLEAGQEPTDDQRARASALVSDINWPDGYPEPPQLDALRKLAGKRQRTADKALDPDRLKAQTERLEDTLGQLEAALEAKLLKESRQLLKSAQQNLRELDPRSGRRFQARMQLLNGQFRELNDWQGFATEPKQIALCEQMEYLAEQPMDPEAKAQRIKELQNEWRELGGSSDRPLWSRFKAASDRAYEPCKAYFSAKSGLKEANLEKRIAICDQLESFVENADWAAIDWKAAERIHQTARQEWKDAWPVEFRENRQVQKRFDDLLKRLEAPLDEERRKNEALKADIVARAQALVEHEPLSEAMNRAKALQGEWQSVGITRHREDRKLWQAFRKACDRIFARRDAERDEQKQASRAADEAARACLQQAAEQTPDSDQASVEAAIAELNDLDTSALSRNVRDQVQQEQQRLRQLQSRLALQKQVADWQVRVLAATRGEPLADTPPSHWLELAQTAPAAGPDELVVRAEILCGVASPESDQQRRMEIQVQRLADGMGAQDASADRLREVEALVARWCLDGQATAADQAQAERFNRALAGLKP